MDIIHFMMKFTLKKMIVFNESRFDRKNNQRCIYYLLSI